MGPPAARGAREQTSVISAKLDTGFTTGMRAIFLRSRRCVAARGTADQVRKIAIMATMKITAAEPYFTSMMKPS
jgi:hypothetical protein